VLGGGGNCQGLPKIRCDGVWADWTESCPPKSSEKWGDKQGNRCDGKDAPVKQEEQTGARAYNWGNTREVRQKVLAENLSILDRGMATPLMGGMFELGEQRTAGLKGASLGFWGKGSAGRPAAKGVGGEETQLL